MSTAVIYYSLEGNTRLAATKLAQRIGADVFEIRTVKPYPTKGLRKFLLGGRDSAFGKFPQIERLEVDPSEYDLVVLALPVWAGKAAAPINSFLRGRVFGGARVALLIASASGDATSCAKDLSVKLGRAQQSMPTLSLRNPGKMPAAELDAQLDAFADQLG